VPRGAVPRRTEVLTADNIASLIVYAITAPERVSINEGAAAAARQVN
jgi:NADP-dependent 3-hydroxy acid dehydrogenase YdfG